MDRVLTRQLSIVRSKLSGSELRNVLKSTNTHNLQHLIEPCLAKHVTTTDVPMGESSLLPQGLKVHSPEADIFVGLLCVIFLIDLKALQDARLVSLELVKMIGEEHSLEHLGSKVYFYHVRVHELMGHVGEVRPLLLASYRSAVIHHWYFRQAVLINLILRSYYLEGQVEQAQKFSSKVTFPETRSNAEYARYLYYVGLIKAVQLQYTESHSFLMQAVRKAPPETAKGFRLAATKAGVVVELLMGEIPERSRFNTFKTQLAPYIAVTDAVRRGDVTGFSGILAKNEKGFASDRLLSLIQRLHQNVIKAGLRTITTCYSRVSLADVAAKLALTSVQEASDVTAKAIVDGVIDARIDYKHGVLESAWGQDVFSSIEPREQLHKRIAFCLQLHTDAVRAMEYPDVNEIEKELMETNEEILRSQKIDLEEALAEDDDDMMM